MLTLIALANSISLVMAPLEIDIEIDIKPYSDSNCIYDNDKGVIPVVIFGSEEIEGLGEFDVTMIWVGTIELEGLGVKIVGKQPNIKEMAHFEDVNGDGIMDMVVQIKKESGVLSSGTARLTGIIGDQYQGIIYFEGTDSICVVS